MSLYSTDRPEFIERLAALAGGTTYRMPTAGKGTKLDQLPDTHAIAAALAFARIDPEDIGPDVAYCWAIQSDAYKQRCIRRLAVALQCHELRAVAAHRLAAAEIAWDVMIHNRRPDQKPPADCNVRLWDRMLLAAIGTLHAAAWDAVATAAKAYRKSA